MIKLADLLKESTEYYPPNTLYHFTTPENFVKIFNSDKIKSHSKFNQISFTENHFFVAKNLLPLSLRFYCASRSLYCDSNTIYIGKK